MIQICLLEWESGMINKSSRGKFHCLLMTVSVNRNKKLQKSSRVCWTLQSTEDRKLPNICATDRIDKMTAKWTKTPITVKRAPNTFLCRSICLCPRSFRCCHGFWLVLGVLFFLFSLRDKIKFQIRDQWYTVTEHLTEPTLLRAPFRYVNMCCALHSQ